MTNDCHLALLCTVSTEQGVEFCELDFLACVLVDLLVRLRPNELLGSNIHSALEAWISD